MSGWSESQVSGPVRIEGEDPPTEFVESGANLTALLEEVVERLKRKNREYATSQNPFENFDVGADILRVDPWVVAFFYATKHIAWLAKVAAERTTPDPAEAREKLGDIAAYMSIIMALIERDA